MTLSGRSGTPQPMVYKEAQMTPAARHSLRRREEGGSLSLCRVPACAAIVGEFNCFDPNLHKELLPAPLKPLTWSTSYGLPGSTESVPYRICSYQCFVLLLDFLSLKPCSGSVSTGSTCFLASRIQI